MKALVFWQHSRKMDQPGWKDRLAGYRSQLLGRAGKSQAKHIFMFNARIQIRYIIR